MIIRKSELISIKNTIIKQVERDAQDAVELNTVIDSFKTSLSSATNFEGIFIEKISNKLESYNKALLQRKKLSEDLSIQISSSLDALISAMGNDEEIDTSKKSELEASYRRCMSSISYLEGQLNALPTDEEHFNDIRRIIVNKQSYVRDAASIKKDINKIETVESQDGTQQRNLSSLDSSVAYYHTLTDEITSQESNITI